MSKPPSLQKPLAPLRGAPDPSLPGKVNPYTAPNGSTKGSLHDILKAEYGPDLKATLQAKREYREEVGSRAEWRQSLANRDLKSPVSIRTEAEDAPEQTKVLKDDVAGIPIGVYRLKENDIVVLKDLSDKVPFRCEEALQSTIVRHELRHRTQKVGLEKMQALERSHQGKEGFSAEEVQEISETTHGNRLSSVGLGGPDSTANERYQTSAHELEARLGELNDFAHGKSGKAITSPIETVHALHNAGAKVDPVAVEKAFKNLHLPYDPADLPKGEPGSTGGKWHGVEDIKSLLQNQNLTDEQRQKVLEEVIIKAPGVVQKSPSLEGPKDTGSSKQGALAQADLKVPPMDCRVPDHSPESPNYDFAKAGSVRNSFAASIVSGPSGIGDSGLSTGLSLNNIGSAPTMT